MWCSRFSSNLCVEKDSQTQSWGQMEKRDPTKGTHKTTTNTLDVFSFGWITTNCSSLLRDLVCTFRWSLQCSDASWSMFKRVCSLCKLLHAKLHPTPIKTRRWVWLTVGEVEMSSRQGHPPWFLLQYWVDMAESCRHLITWSGSVRYETFYISTFW